MSQNIYFFPVVVEEPVLEDNVLNSSDDFLHFEATKPDPEPVKPVWLDSNFAQVIGTDGTSASSDALGLASTEFHTDLKPLSPAVTSAVSSPLTAAMPSLASASASSTAESTASPTPTVISSIRASFSRTPSPTYSNPTSGVSSTSYQFDQFDRPASNQDILTEPLPVVEPPSASVTVSVATLPAPAPPPAPADKKAELKPVMVRPPPDSGLKIPVSEIDPSLLVFASKSKPRPAKQTVGVKSS